MTNEMKIQVRFPLDVWLATKQFAKEDERSFNAEVIKILEQYAFSRKGTYHTMQENTSHQSQEDPKYVWPNVIARYWQVYLTQKFRTDWFTKGKRYWLIEVAPGGGKTLWSLLLARWLLDARLIDRVVILCPTVHIRNQWINHNRDEQGNDKFKPILQLTWETNKNEAVEGSDFDGIVLTYAQLLSGITHQVKACRERRTLVIADEIHHVGRKRAYGIAYTQAFQNAATQIGLTGTPWTSPGAGVIPIPHIEYEIDEKGKEGKVKNDGYQYTRKEAITDNVLRPMQFFAFNGEVKLQDIDSCSPTEIIMRLDDPETESSDLLKYCINPYSDWMKSILKEADNALLGIIQGTDGDEAVPDAKGLVTAKSIKYAYLIKTHLEQITRQPVAIMTSRDDEGAANKEAREELEKFKEGKKGRWMVSVQMVSEGVDIQSLFVGVYVTDINAKKFWRQFIGRFERKRHPDERSPMVFFPATKALMELASTMNKEVPQTLEEWEAPERKTSPDEPPTLGSEIFNYQTSAADLHRIIEDDRVFRPEEHKQGIALAEKMGIPTRYALKVFEAWQEFEKTKQHDTSTSNDHDHSESSEAKPSGPQIRTMNNDQIKRELKRDVDKLVKTVGIMRCELRNDTDPDSRRREISKISFEMNQRRRVKDRSKMNIQQLKEERAYLLQLKDELNAKLREMGKTIDG